MKEIRIFNTGNICGRSIEIIVRKTICIDGIVEKNVWKNCTEKCVPYDDQQTGKLNIC